MSHQEEVSYPTGDFRLRVGGQWFLAYFLDCFPRVVIHLRGTMHYIHMSDPRIEEWRD
jgi:hypothetical protein